MQEVFKASVNCWKVFKKISELSTENPSRIFSCNHENFPKLYDSFIFQDVRDRELPNKVISVVEAMNNKPGEADCVLLLLCKLKPFVWSMQKAIDTRIVGEPKQRVDDVNKQEPLDRMSVFFKYVPSLDEFQNNGSECEENYPKCKLFWANNRAEEMVWAIPSLELLCA